MEGELNPQPKPKSSGLKLGLAIGISVLVTAAIAGGAVYFWQNGQLKTSKDDMQQQINQLQNTVNQLQPPVNTNVNENVNVNTNFNTNTNANQNTNTVVNTNTNTEETGWDTFTSQQWKFSLEYPTEGNHLDASREDQGYINLWTESEWERVQNSEGTEAFPITFAAYENPSKLTALEWLKSGTSESNFSEPYNPGEEYDTIKVDGRDAISYTWEGLGFGDSVAFTSDDKTIVYQFTVSHGALNDPRVAEFHDILETVQF